jgi:uncharacterized protein YbbK (DUF523 family)
MLLAHHPEAVEAMRPATVQDPWRVLVSGCLAAWTCGVNGTDYGLGAVLRELFALPTIRTIPFCPEQYSLGTPRTMPDIHGGDGMDVLAGRARVLDEHGADLTAQMIAGARAMLAHALEHRVELAIVTDMSAACGSQVISDGCRLVAERRFQKGVGIATALLLEAKISVVSQRDFRTIAAIRKRLDPTYEIAAGLLDHHDHPWTVEHLPGVHPRAGTR